MMKNRIYEILDGMNPEDRVGYRIKIFMSIVILLNVAAVIFETVGDFGARFYIYFYIFEVVSIVIFTIEYALRIWTCTSNIEFQHALRGRIKFLISPYAVIDLLAILPFYLPYLIAFDLRFLRALRLFRIFRLLKLARYTDAIKTLGIVIRSRKEELFITVLVLSILLIVASGSMYFIESQAQPEIFSSIPATMWWAIETLTTVGYGDIYPITTIGKILGAFIAIMGIGFFALPTGILGSGFIEEIHNRKNKAKSCPHCGKEI